MNGNWITGIKPIDTFLVGPQDDMPFDITNNKGHNVYYMLGTFSFDNYFMLYGDYNLENYMGPPNSLAGTLPWSILPRMSRFREVRFQV